MRDLLVLFIVESAFLGCIYFILKKKFKNLKDSLLLSLDKNSSSIVNINILVPEFSLKFTREMRLHLMYNTHKILHPELGTLTIENTIDICVNENSEQTKLSIYVSMPSFVKDNMVKAGKDYFTERMKNYGFLISE
jgi:hypothetical protein